MKLRSATALNMLKKMRWTDNSMGANFDMGWSDINQAFAAGNIGMYLSGSDVYTNLVQASNVDPSIYGLAPVPLAKSKTAGVLGDDLALSVQDPKRTGVVAGFHLRHPSVRLGDLLGRVQVAVRAFAEPDRVLFEEWFPPLAPTAVASSHTRFLPKS